MLNVVYLVIFVLGNNGVTSQAIPQANMQQCMLNKKVYNGKELKSATTTANDIQIRATCVVGVMSK